MGKQRVNKEVLYLSELAILIAIILLMAFTPIGYIKTAGLEITLITIPVIVGAIVLGPLAGMILGLVFGLTSFLQCVFGLSSFGIVALAISVWRTFVLCVPTRLLMGWLTGLIFKLFKKRNFAAYSITSLCGALLNTLFFMSALLLLFWNTDIIQGTIVALGSSSPILIVGSMITINVIIEAVICFVAAGLISKAVDAYVNHDQIRAVEQKEQAKEQISE